MFDDVLDESIKATVCPQTEAGWLWYCDAHDTHGNADSEQEARHVSIAHIAVTGNDEACDVVVWQRKP